MEEEAVAMELWEPSRTALWIALMPVAVLAWKALLFAVQIVELVSIQPFATAQSTAVAVHLATIPDSLPVP